VTRKEKKRNTGENREGNRERETDSVEREMTETVETKKTGDIDRETERDRRGEGRKRTEEVNRWGRRH
jgi:hypothetical protein